MRQIQNGQVRRNGGVAAGATTEEALRHLAARHEKLEREVALLRTIVLRLVSEPVDYPLIVRTEC